MSNANTRHNESVTEELSYTLEHEYDTKTPPSIAIVQAICALENIDPMTLPTEEGFILRDHIDPSALDALLGDSPGNGDTVVSFEIVHENTYAVDVSDDGHIVVRYGHVT